MPFRAELAAQLAVQEQLSGGAGVRGRSPIRRGSAPKPLNP